jgi:hypothetical protein
MLPATTALEEVTFTLNVVLVIVVGSICSLNVTAIGELTATPVALFAGETVVTVGATASALAVVVNVDVACAANALPAASFTPVVTVRV